MRANVVAHVKSLEYGNQESAEMTKRYALEKKDLMIYCRLKLEKTEWGTQLMETSLSLEFSVKNCRSLINSNSFICVLGTLRFDENPFF